MPPAGVCVVKSVVSIVSWSKAGSVTTKGEPGSAATGFAPSPVTLPSPPTVTGTEMSEQGGSTGDVTASVEKNS